MASGRIPAPSYRKVYEEGRALSNKYLVMYFRPNENGPTLGISISKRLGKACVRNKARRRVREAFRQMIPSVRAGGDFVFVIRRPAVTGTFRDILGAMQDLLKRMEVI